MRAVDGYTREGNSPQSLAIGTGLAPDMTEIACFIDPNIIETRFIAYGQGYQIPAGQMFGYEIREVYVRDDVGIMSDEHAAVQEICRVFKGAAGAEDLSFPKQRYLIGIG